MSRRRDLAEKLKAIRRYTGDRFSAAAGYDARKPLSKARLKTIERYYQAVYELTSRPHMIVTPKRGEKREAFEFTGQKGFPRFKVAIVGKPVASDPYGYSIDKSRPKGSRFILENKRTRERSWHIPAEVFVYENAALYDPQEEVAPEFFEDVLNEYAEIGAQNVYMIEAGDYHMWGSAGSIPQVASKLSELFKEYGADNFDADDRNSHFIGNWFRGVQVFGAQSAIAYQTERGEAAAMRIREANKKAGGKPAFKFGENFRLLKSGDIGRFQFGRLVEVIPAASNVRTRDGKRFKVKRAVYGKPKGKK